MSIAAVIAGTRQWWVEPGDVRAGLAKIPDGSVQVCVTSPPYWGLRVVTDSKIWICLMHSEDSYLARHGVARNRSGIANGSGSNTRRRGGVQRKSQRSLGCENSPFTTGCESTAFRGAKLAKPGGLSFGESKGRNRDQFHLLGCRQRRRTPTKAGDFGKVIGFSIFQGTRWQTSRGGCWNTDTLWPSTLGARCIRGKSSTTGMASRTITESKTLRSLRTRDMPEWLPVRFAVRPSRFTNGEVCSSGN